MGIRISTRGRTRTVLALLGVLAVAATACESTTITQVNAVRTAHARSGLTPSVALGDAARAHSQAMCTAGAVSPSPDPLAAYAVEPADAIVELVGSATLDPSITEWGPRNGAAANEIWAGWEDDPRLLDPQW